MQFLSRRGVGSLRILSTLRAEKIRFRNFKAARACLSGRGGHKRMNDYNREGSSRRARLHPRIHSLREISIEYEGYSEPVNTRPPDISIHGMFINTTRKLPEGAVLNLRFRLDLTDAEIHTRCEVRYFLPGVGVGVEFVGISPEAIHSIQEEIKLSNKKRVRKSSSSAEKVRC
jgi:PilZ domain